MFYTNLNEEEKAQLKKFAKTSASNFSLTDNEAGELFGKLTGLRDVINTKLDAMQPESRRFIENLLRRFLAAFSQDGLMNILEALKGFGKEVVDMFDGLSKPIQNDILKAFPIIGSYVTSDITRLMLRKLAELDLISRTSTLAPTVDHNKGDPGDFPSPQLIGPKNPGDFDSDDNTGFEKEKSVTTTMYPSNGNEEVLSIKKVVGNK
ncbi:hypothetical protein LOAG_01451 [Loa loa]|uniref:Uncharacterized protein n=1 Tax=Loa loa TaxID=7209 RepID=A0A1S0U9C2_LOALO|nr:hypothetical protein LOAG_01451 [Loa loa]EFO27031.2 hypothetical protein LOAG_01451 [Loa loa]